jgi:hypothetical protein
MAPPYDLRMYVYESSAKRYERAYLTVRVAAELGHPLSRADIRSSIWEGGTISLTVKFHEGRYVAERVEAHPEFAIVTAGLRMHRVPAGF